MLKMPVFCKLCLLKEIVLWAIVGTNNLRYSMTAELHYQLVNDSSKICSLQLVNSKKE